MNSSAPPVEMQKPCAEAVIGNAAAWVEQTADRLFPRDRQTC